MASFARKPRVVRWGLGVALALGSLAAVRAALPRRSPHVRVELPTAFGAPEIRRGQNGSPQRWQQRDVPIQIDPAVEQALPGATDAVKEAFAAWQGRGTELPRFSFTLAKTSETSPQVDGVNRVLYGPIEIPGYRNALAITLTYVDEATGEILEADLLLNSRHGLGLLSSDAESKAAAAQRGHEDDARGRSDAPSASGSDAQLTSCGGSARSANSCGSQYDLPSVLTHEAGHVLGLGDDPTEAMATMYYCTSPCETHKRQPRLTDTDAVDEVYAGGFEERSAPSCAAAPPRSRAGCALWVACLLLAARSSRVARFWAFLLGLPRLLLRATRNSSALVVATAALGALGAFAYVLRQPVIYRSTASVLIEPQERNYRSEQQYLKSQAKLMTSRHLASLTAERLGLSDDSSFVGVKARVLEGTRLINVSLDDPDPERARWLLGALVETLVEESLADPATGRTTNLEQRTLEQERKALSASFADQASMLENELGQVTRSLAEARIRKQELASLNELYQAVKDRAFDLRRLELEYRRLERLMDRAPGAEIRTLDEPLPGVRVKPNVPGTVAVGLFLGLAVGWMAAYMRLLFGHALRSREDQGAAQEHGVEAVAAPSRAAGSQF